MPVAVSAALGAAVLFGTAAVLQALAVARTPSTGLDRRWVLRLLGRWQFRLALLLNVVGFGLHVVALQVLPLFLVQAAISSSVAVTAVLAGQLLHLPLHARQWLGVAAVCVGLTALGNAASAGADRSTPGLPAALALALLLVVATAFLLGRVRISHQAAVYGLLAGVCFAIVAVSARLLPDLTARAVLAAPSSYVLLAAGGVGFVLYSAAMHQGSVTTATAALVLTQTTLPALVGVLLLGDQVRPGSEPLAGAGLVLALAGTLALAAYEHFELPALSSAASRPVRCDPMTP